MQECYRTLGLVRPAVECYAMAVRALEGENAARQAAIKAKESSLAALNPPIFTQAQARSIIVLLKFLSSAPEGKHAIMREEVGTLQS